MRSDVGFAGRIGGVVENRIPEKDQMQRSARLG